jgi:hypothetical protein
MRDDGGRTIGGNANLTAERVEKRRFNSAYSAVPAVKEVSCLAAARQNLSTDNVNVFGVRLAQRSTEN